MERGLQPTHYSRSENEKLLIYGKCASGQRGSGETEYPRIKSSNTADQSPTALMIYENFQFGFQCQMIFHDTF